ncbi:hypothetical protein FJT64_016298 [Amphibalanus amphitrite]|uniref:Inactive serine protease scarface clip-domain domain-containing protein n=1 Tax=Amphibalanus amphitrite TaxID=1232801 RepID=A0A6A4X6U0_AMPAM|nr:hypothetical protein FJT64_016298 [Amphibalanus amphitrite]
MRSCRLLWLLLAVTLVGGWPDQVPGEAAVSSEDAGHQVALQAEMMEVEAVSEAPTNSDSHSPHVIPASDPASDCADTPSSAIPASDYAGLPDSITEGASPQKSGSLGQTGIDFGAGIEVTPLRPGQSGHHNPFAPDYKPPPELSQAWELTALPCVPRSACDPYSGYLVTDNYQLGYPITAETPTVAMVHCQLGGNLVGVCCRKFPKLRPQADGADPSAGEGLDPQPESESPPGQGEAAPYGLPQEAADEPSTYGAEARREVP